MFQSFLKKSLSFKILPEYLNVISGPKLEFDTQFQKNKIMRFDEVGSADKYCELEICSRFAQYAVQNTVNSIYKKHNITSGASSPV